MSNEANLNMVFKICDNVEYDVDKDGIVTIFEKQDYKIQKFFRKLKFKIPMYKKVELDKYSIYVFSHIDGEKTVKDLGEVLDLKYGKESHPLYERLLLFLNHIEVNCKYIEKMNE